MNMSKTEITEYLGNPHMPTIAVVYATDVDYATHVDFRAYEIVEWDDDGPIYPREGSQTSMDDVRDLERAERYLVGTVKWDGCTHVTFGNEDGYLHLCGCRSVGQLANTLSTIYERCGAIMRARGVNVLEGQFKA